MYRVIIAGGRDFDDYALLTETMDNYISNIRDDIVIVCGKARGADTLAKRYATSHGYSVLDLPTEWHYGSKTASFIRTPHMAEKVDGLVTFWDGKSLGTKHMINTAKQWGLNIYAVRYKKIRKGST